MPRSSFTHLYDLDYFQQQGRVIKVQATKGPNEVYKETREKLEARLGKDF